MNVKKVKKVKPLKLMITIVDRGKSKKLMSYYKSQNINFSILCFGKGTEIGRAHV